MFSPGPEVTWEGRVLSIETGPEVTWEGRVLSIETGPEVTWKGRVLNIGWGPEGDRLEGWMRNIGLPISRYFPEVFFGLSLPLGNAGKEKCKISQY